MSETHGKSSRGVALRLSLPCDVMDGSEYFRGVGENSLRMRKNRLSQGGRAVQPPPSVEELSRRLAESEQIIGDMAEELSSCYESLAAIFRYSAEQGKAISLEDFARRLLSDLLRITAADWFVFRLVPKDQAQLVVFTASEPRLELAPLPVPAVADTASPAEVRSDRKSTRLNSSHRCISYA